MQSKPYMRLFAVLAAIIAVLGLWTLGATVAAPQTDAHAGSPAYHSNRIAAPNEDGTPRATEPPEATHPPEATEPPDATHSPEATEPPEATHSPEATEPPEATHPPEATESPEATHPPEATESPEATPPPEATETAQPTATLPPPISTTTVLPTATTPAAPQVPGVGSREFPETHQTIHGVFLSYWQQQGALEQQGLPVSGLLREVSALDGKPYTVQYFERAVFELHPENAGTPYEILLAQLGTYQYRQKYAHGTPPQTAHQANGQFFAQTDHWVGGKFWTYWQQHGGLAQQGYPLSDEFTEVSQLDGKPYTVQYFERAVFELHPEYAGTPYEVLLAQLGMYQYRQQHGK